MTITAKEIQNNLNQASLDVIQERTQSIQNHFGQGAKLQTGIEIEFVTISDGVDDIDYEKLNEQLNEQLEERFGGHVKVKTEGAAFVAFGKDWIENGDPSNRTFIPDRPVETILDGNAPARVLRREVVLDHKNASPEKALQMEAHIRQFITDYVSKKHDGISHVSFDPKYITDAKHFNEERVDSIVEHLKANDFLSKDAEVSSLEELAEKYDIHLAPCVPGNGLQNNYSIVAENGEYPMFDSETMDGTKEAWHMLCGLRDVVEAGVFAFNSTPNSYDRLSSQTTNRELKAAECAVAKPRESAYNESKTEGAAFRFAPYSEELQQRFARMAAERGADYFTPRTPEEAHIETRVGDPAGSMEFQMALELSAMAYGLEKYKDFSIEEAQAYLASPECKKPLPTSLPEAIEKYRDSEKFLREVAGDELYEAGLEYAKFQENEFAPYFKVEKMRQEVSDNIANQR